MNPVYDIINSFRQEPDISKGREGCFQLSVLLYWWVKSCPQEVALKHFLYEVFPTLKQEDNGIWKLQAIGSQAAGDAIAMLLSDSKTKEEDMVKIIDISSHWIKSNYFTTSLIHWHKCNENCHMPCPIRVRCLEFIDKVTSSVVLSKNENLGSQMCRIALLYGVIELCQDLRNTFNSFDFKESKSYFVKFTGKARFFVFQKMHPRARQELNEALTSENNAIFKVGEQSYTSSESYVLFSNMASTLCVKEITWAHNVMSITKFSILEFTAALDGGNHGIILHMVKEKFPDFIRSQKLLTDLLYALSKNPYNDIWNEVCDYIFSVTDTKKITIDPADAIELMCTPFFSSIKNTIGNNTNWIKIPNIDGRRPYALLQDYDVVKLLEQNGILKIWSRSPRRPKFSVFSWAKSDAKCIAILKNFNLL